MVDAVAGDADTVSSSTVVEYLERRGVLAADSRCRVSVLGGGVSNDALRVDCDSDEAGPGVSVVVKQALARLRVADQWYANRERTLTEAAALKLTRRLTPGMVPAVIDVDPGSIVLTMEAAPPAWRDWKTILLAPVPPDTRALDADELTVAQTLGRTLGSWHTATCDGKLAGTRFDDPDTFEQLRVAPYFRTVMQRCPQHAPAVQHVIDEMTASRICLVHGDFSPKNILVGSDGVWVIDFEVAHLGDPRFDVAFLLCHLVLKSVHQPGRAAAHRAAAEGFVTAYRAGAAPPLHVLNSGLSAQVGALLLARVYGKSPAEYLSSGAQEMVADIGTRLLDDAPDDPLSAWEGMEP